MKKFSIIIIALFVLCGVFSQTVTLTFTGRDANNNWVQLEQNTPNPFNGVMDVTLYVAEAGTVTLTVIGVNPSQTVPWRCCRRAGDLQR